ncbi:hypothetical protein [Cytobacillus kochii]|uniref:hypothetical protein n=1 Tax=Cytobacillus kochii TaxID=859143 RepID=UPI002041C274|nr:hypothetical protein [Cytobacillus kochii]MCM3324764.1 hypothetical protein [Cytobacillus kochii]MCM3347157.1 hypothetical protein [Cytobacillus kochii]
MNTTLVMDEMKKTAENELGRFFSLFGDGVENLVMPKSIVDEVWHEKLKREDYEEFCMRNANQLVGHAPINGKGEIGWFTKYENKFGKLDKVWFTDKKGTLDAESYRKYIESKNPSMEWDCVPIGTDD